MQPWHYKLELCHLCLVLLSNGKKTCRETVCPFGVCAEAFWCPHAVQVSLATNQMWMPRDDGCAKDMVNVDVAQAQQRIGREEGNGRRDYNSVPEPSSEEWQGDGTGDNVVIGG